MLDFKDIQVENKGNIEDWNREYESIKQHMKLNKGESFIDIGAHIGLWTLYVAKKGNKVYSFEPDINTFKILKNNIKKYSNVKVYNLAIGAEDKVESMYVHKNSVLNSLRIVRKDLFLYKVRVQINKLDNFKFEEKIGLIKIDTEGYESEILIGAEETILRDKPKLIIEVHHGLRPLGLELKILFDRVQKYGYDNIRAEYKKVCGQPILIAE